MSNLPMDDVAHKPEIKPLVCLTETTFRKMVGDYIYKRMQFKKKMEWVSDYGPKIILRLEERPFLQESLGYMLELDKRRNK